LFFAPGVDPGANTLPVLHTAFSFKNLIDESFKLRSWRISQKLVLYPFNAKTKTQLPWGKTLLYFPRIGCIASLRLGTPCDSCVGDMA